MTIDKSDPKWIDAHLLKTYSDLDWSLIPSYMWPGVKQYYEYGLAPGDFFYLILEHDFYQAIFHADHANKACIANWAQFTFFLPFSCHGSVDIVKTWIRDGGARGIHNKYMHQTALMELANEKPQAKI